MSTPAQLAVTGIAPRGIRAKASQVITNVVAANSTLPLRVSGSEFYVLAASTQINIRPSAAGSVGIFDSFTTGTGKRFGEINAFEMIEVQNTNAFPVVFSIFVGWDDYIDKRLIVASNVNPQVAYPTYPTPNAANNINITDLSGQQFTDINGNKWYAMNRVAILVFNPDAGVTLNVQKAGSVVANGPAVGIVYPQTSLRLDISGNYCINVGGGNINAVVTEIYNSVVSPTP